MLSLSVDGVFDIECENWTTFVVGALWTRAEGMRIFDDESELATAILATRGCVWAHAGGSYDFLWLLKHLRLRGLGATITEQGSRILSVRCGDTWLRDSYALVPLSLARAAPMFDARKHELGFACECGEQCGGYCAIRRDMSQKRKRQLKSYLAADVEATRMMIKGALAWLRAYGVEPRATVGATAWQWARKFSGLPSANHTYSNAVRRAYYGGRAEVYRTTASTVYRYDIRSAYPAALVQAKLPMGKPRVLLDDEAGCAYRVGRPGVYCADVQISTDVHIPPLPLRTRERLWFPTGNFIGWYVRDELYCAESHGARIQNIGKAIVYDVEEPSLADWCAMIWRLRELDSMRAPWIKLIANSLTGKLAQRPEVRVTRLLGVGDEPRLGEEMIGDPSAGVCTRTVRRDHACAHIIWAATLTAMTRIELYEQLLHAGEDATYCDTDSVFATRPLERRLGAGLGAWKDEGIGKGWCALAPKLYRFTQGADTHLRAKGMSRLDPAGFDALARGEPWHSSVGVRTLRAAAAMGDLWSRRSLARSLHAQGGWVGGRRLCSDGIRTRAPQASEIFLNK